MRKPTAFQFFAAELVVWLTLLAWVVVTDDKIVPHILFVKLSIVNVSVACFNIVGAAIGAATGFFPFRS